MGATALAAGSRFGSHWPDRDDYVKRSEPELATLLATGWRRSVWDTVEVIQAVTDQVHVRTRFARLDAFGARLAVFDSIYVLTRQGARWGTIIRSGFGMTPARAVAHVPARAGVSRA